MKFRARFAHALPLSKLVQTLDKIGDSCIVHLTPESIAFAIVGDAGDGIQVWADLARSSLFLEYRIESKADNQISFTSRVGNLHRALKSACANINVQTVVKLTKKTGIPTFSFEIQQPQTQLKITHDVPIRLILDNTELKRYYEPSISDDVLLTAASVVLPSSEIRSLRNIVERMRSFSPQVMVLVSTSAKGNNLRLQVKESVMSISTTISKLEAVVQDGAPPSCSASAKVEIKKLSKVLQSLVASDIKVTHLICCIIPDRTVVLKCFIQAHSDNDMQNTVVYYLPAYFLDS